jgi:hypothetical protein
LYSGGFDNSILSFSIAESNLRIQERESFAMEELYSLKAEVYKNKTSTKKGKTKKD